ncbi:MAG: CvpA family protein [Paludibacteraceae bacterium]|nr:CvpA family protein [Paludibacteraceae bacterium]
MAEWIGKICWLDVVILLPVLVGLVRGLMRGLVTELNAILAVVLAVVGARLWGGKLALWLHQTTSWAQEFCNILSYVLLFLAIALALNFCGHLLQSLLKKIHLGWVNRLLGCILGTCKWCIIVLVLVFVVGQLDKRFKFMPDQLKQHSITYQPALDTANHIWSQADWK